MIIILILDFISNGSISYDCLPSQTTRNTRIKKEIDLTFIVQK